MGNRFRHDRFCFNLDLNFGTLFELDLFPTLVGQGVWNSKLSIQMIGPFDGDLRLFGLARTGMRLNHLLDLPWERCTCLGRFNGHDGLQ